MTTQDESNAIPTPESNQSAESSTQSRSSNLRSRWKRKGANNGTQLNAASTTPACGEIDPATLRGTLQPTRHSPAAEASEPSACNNTENTSSNTPCVPCTQGENKAPREPRAERAHSDRPRTADRTADRPTRPAREQGHYNHIEEGAEPKHLSKPIHEQPRNNYRERTPRPTSDNPRSHHGRSSESSHTRSHEASPRNAASDRRSSPKAPITPATYRPMSLPADTLWNRFKDFVGSIIGSKEASASNSDKHRESKAPRQPYTPRNSSDRKAPGSGDRPYRRSGGGGGSSNRGRGGEGHSRSR